MTTAMTTTTRSSKKSHGDERVVVDVGSASGQHYKNSASHDKSTRNSYRSGTTTTNTNSSSDRRRRRSSAAAAADTTTRRQRSYSRPREPVRPRVRERVESFVTTTKTSTPSSRLSSTTTTTRPLRRTRSCESMVVVPDPTTTSSTTKSTTNVSTRSTTSTSTTNNNNIPKKKKEKKNTKKKLRVPAVDERGLPLTSDWCPPVASLPSSTTCSSRADSPNNVETQDFYHAMVQMRKLQQQQQKLQQQQSQHVVVDDDEDDRKMPAVTVARTAGYHSRTKSKKSLYQQQQQQQRNMTWNVNEPAEAKAVDKETRKSRQGQRQEEAVVAVPRNRFHPAEEEDANARALEFVDQLAWILFNYQSNNNYQSNSHQQYQQLIQCRPMNVAGGNMELVQWVKSMMTTLEELASSTSTNTNTTTNTFRVDVGYHYCRRCNLQRIQQEAGFWSKIQSRRVHKSQHGNGIVTFDQPRPLLFHNDNQLEEEEDEEENVWMIVARLQARTAPMVDVIMESSMVAFAAAGQEDAWQGGHHVDSLVRQDDGIVVLKTCQQLFPLALLTLSSCNYHHQYDKHQQQQVQELQVLQQRLQTILDDCFQKTTSTTKSALTTTTTTTINKKISSAAKTAANMTVLNGRHDSQSKIQDDDMPTFQKPTTSSKDPPLSFVKKSLPCTVTGKISQSHETFVSSTTRPMTRSLTASPAAAAAAAAAVATKSKKKAPPTLGPIPNTVQQVTKPSPPTPPPTTTTNTCTLAQTVVTDPGPNAAAWDFAMQVQTVVEEHTTNHILAAAGGIMATEHNNITPSPPLEYNDCPLFMQCAVDMEEMTTLAENMLATQQSFQAATKSGYVDIGYHYCRGHNLRKIQQKPGFWSNIQSRGVNRSEDGDGIYTFNNPLGTTRCRGNRSGSFLELGLSVGHHEDDVWLLVARLQGRRQQGTASESRQWCDDYYDSIVLPSDDVVVLRTSIQFFPLLQFPASSIDSSAGAFRMESVQELQMIHQRLQHIVDSFFNNNYSGDCVADSDQLRLPTITMEVLDYQAPETLDLTKSIQSSSLQVYKILSHNKKASNDDCSICLDSLRWTTHQQVVRLRNCGHEFHRACLHEALDYFDLCPICNQPVMPPTPQSCLHGLSPSGTMVTTTSSQTFCDGCWAPGGSLILSYYLPEGHQKEYHPSPGASYASSSWQAYLPYNEQGVQLLRRLQYAFLHGLLFVIEAGNNSSFSWRTAWSTIPHILQAGSIPGSRECNGGHPDATYFDQCNHELGRCGVPDSAGCERFIASRCIEREPPSHRSTKQSPLEITLHEQPPASMSSKELEYCSKLLEGLKQHPSGWMFCKSLPLLVGKVERQLDLTMIEERLKRHEYSGVEEFHEDVNVVFDFALMHHSKENPVHFMAKQLKRKFKQDCIHY